MAMKHRLSTVVCHELAEAQYAQDALLHEIHQAAADGDISADEWRRILRAERDMVREMVEAQIAAEKSDLALARFEFALRSGPDAEPHTYLRQKERDFLRLVQGCGVGGGKREKERATALTVARRRTTRVG